MHAVFKESSSKTELQVVFDASTRTSSGYSLNDTLAVSPTVYTPITKFLMRFRDYPIVLSSNISKMYCAF